MYDDITHLKVKEKPFRFRVEGLDFLCVAVARHRFYDGITGALVGRCSRDGLKIT